MLALAGCPRPVAPRVAAPSAITRAVDGPVRAIASDGHIVVVASGARLVWGEHSVALPADAPAIAAGSGRVAAAVAITGEAELAGARMAVRGEPGTVIVAFDLATGAPRWRLPFEATEYAIVTSIAAAPDGGFVVGGSFGGTLRAGSAVVSSAGKSDGFVARIAPTGQLGWLVRFGGAGADAVQGVAVAGDRVALAGTFTAGAELGGLALPAFDDRVPFADVLAAELDLATGARAWAVAFGGKLDDTVAGVAVTPSGNVAVAANLRDTMRVGDTELHASGPSDGLVVWLSRDGQLGATAVLGGDDFDGLRAITAVGEHAVVGGFFSGRIQLGPQTFTAGGGDDAFLASITPAGTIDSAWQVGGQGREEIAGLAALPAGFVAAIQHTADLAVSSASAASHARLPAPADPMTGAALLVRPL